MAKRSEETYKYGILCLAILLLIVLIVAGCACSEHWTKVGYPRPQGNLPNFQYGTIPKFKKEAEKQWNSVLKKTKETFNTFSLPRSKTVLV